MKTHALVFFLALLIVGCSIATKQEREGQRLFASCDSKGVNDKETLKSGEFVCKGKRINPFHGSRLSMNNRSCGDCHQPGTNFSLTPARVAMLPDDHPVFFDGIDENLEKLRSDALIHVLAPGGIDEFRQTPKLIHLRDLCKKHHSRTCDGLGLGGDRIENLHVFTTQAIENHMTATTARIPGEDFRVPTTKELKAISAYMTSRLVSEQDER